MSPKNDRVLLLEPPNLLAPADLREGFIEPEVPSSRSEPTSMRKFTPPRMNAPVSSASIRRGWPPILIAAGALVCFGAGIAMPRLPNLAFDANQSSGPPAPATTPAVVVGSTGADRASDHSSEQPSAVSFTAPTSTGAPARSASSPNQPAPVASAGGPSCTPEARANDRCLENDADGPAINLAPVPAPTSAQGPVPVPAAVPDRRAADARAAADRSEGRQNTRPDRQDEERPPPRNRRAAERNAGDQQVDAGDDAAATSAWNRSRSGRDGNRTSTRRPHRAPEVEEARPWERGQDQDYDRRGSWRRDRDDRDVRGDNHRSFGRIVREDDRTIGPNLRSGGPPMFPFFGGW
jgi:hypothetical protein